MLTKIAINGFGRIGRSAFKILLQDKRVEVVGINDLTDTKTLSNLLKYDTVYGKLPGIVKSDKNLIFVGKKKFQITAEKDPSRLPWEKLKVDVVLECTGRFRNKEEAEKHIKAGAKKVIISAPPKSEVIKTFVIGVNEKELVSGDKIISCASCTTNCIAPAIKVLNDSFGVKKALMTTIHSYTADQNLVDGPHSDARRSRAAAQNIVPTTTGAALATAMVIPELKGRFDGMSVRVPTINGSLSDITVLMGRSASEQQVNRAFIKASKSVEYKGILSVVEEPIVSADIIGNPYSAIVDLALTKVVDGDLAKIIVWYDNEWGYSNRLVELAKKAAKFK